VQPADPLDEAAPFLQVLEALGIAYMIDGGSDRHVRDVRAMLAVSGALIDRALLAELVDRLGVRAQWDEVVGTRPSS
jgi:hypothetical protein